MQDWSGQCGLSVKKAGLVFGRWCSPKGASNCSNLPQAANLVSLGPQREVFTIDEPIAVVYD